MVNTFIIIHLFIHYFFFFSEFKSCIKISYGDETEKMSIYIYIYGEI